MVVALGVEFILHAGLTMCCTRLVLLQDVSPFQFLVNGSNEPLESIEALDLAADSAVELRLAPIGSPVVKWFQEYRIRA